MEENRLELVYCRINDSQPEGKRGYIHIYYTTLSGRKMDHIYSPDKDKWNHCYHDLELGQHYIIITENKTHRTHQGTNRWVWTDAFPCTKTQAQKIQDKCGLKPTREELKKAVYETVYSEQERKTRELIHQIMEF